MALTKPLKGKRIYLREVKLTDVNDRYVSWLNDSEVTRYLEVRFHPQNLDTIAGFVAKMRESENEFLYAICLSSNDQHIGNIKLGPVNAHHRSADVSLFIGEKKCWGQGYAAEAIGLVTRFAFRELGLNKLRAGCYAGNEGSARAFERVGYRREGLLRGQVLCDGKETDVITLGLRAVEYREEANR
ncbi:MAG: GNAT family protein [Bdellovibrionota bacterium]